jgi:hypothetical protein
LAEQIFETYLLTWLQSGPVGFEKNIAYQKKQYTHHVTIILCQGDFKEQIKKLARFLPYTTKTCSREDQAWVHLVPSQ